MLRILSDSGKGDGADSEEKHEPASDIDIAVVDSLKVLDPKRPIREADMPMQSPHVRCWGMNGLAGLRIDEPASDRCRDKSDNGS